MEKKASKRKQHSGTNFALYQHYDGACRPAQISDIGYRFFFLHCICIPSFLQGAQG